MWKVILQYVKATFPLIAGCSTFISSAYSQQNIIADKDNTRPEVTARRDMAAKITAFSAIQMEGYNEIQWTTLLEDETRRFIVEYSADGVNYQSAGEMLPVSGEYNLKHYTLDKRTFLYRLRMERKDGKFEYSGIILLGGTDIPPVKLYPTIVEGNTINLRMDFPVQRINIYSPDGRLVMAKELAGASGTIQVAIPPLNSGKYTMIYYGNGWQGNSDFIVGR